LSKNVGAKCKIFITVRAANRVDINSLCLIAVNAHVLQNKSL
jgi:hypothetical protein